MAEDTPTIWRKSSYSTGGGECVEVATLPNGQIAVRDSKNPSGPTLCFSPGAIAIWLTSVKAGALTAR